MIDWAAISNEALSGFDLTSLPPTLELPALPHVVTLFVQRSKDEKAPLKELAAILETDSALTVELLKYVNSSSNGLRNKAKTVLQALSLLGCGRSRMFVIATGVQAAMRTRFSKLVDPTVFWSDNLRKAIFGREIASLLGTDPEVAFVGALLQDYVLPFLTNDLADPYREFMDCRETPSTTLSEFEETHFGWDHGLVGACLARAWQLPGELVCSILYHHGGLHILTDGTLGRSPVAATALSALLPDQFCTGGYGLELLRRLEPRWPAFSLERVAESVDRQHEELGLGIESGLSLVERCKHLDGEPCGIPVATA